ncbi:hypothetical protein GGI25_003060 [Coemansia spiralis]|uniref:DNA repair protein rad9 n=2 Tax=Coemansia TaxID=4863 RepID=A0A9W8KWV4_9FUNG|nr:Rad9-domain-containing protein [Coemansia spiralis]KAJ1994592.1 hypothetical protein EDC05_001509 [Coemansia umbellata]KAJ2624398.1 hypothetical protein GGI26_001533 [Coemansia sp. RSA 1358]KAJ2677540.1 hypothetical protein GGI25_003060 [Coemansia spiralis]
MEAEIPASSLKAFYKALQCLARIGSEISFEARPHELRLIGYNSSRSAYASFTFQQQFFDAYEVDPPSTNHPNPAFRCRVLAKLLVGIFKSRGPSPGHAVEKCILRIEQTTNPVHANIAIRQHRMPSGSSNGSQGTRGATGATDSNSGECRLVVQMEYKQGICRTHRLFYEVCETLHSVYNKDECKNKWRIGAKVAADWIGHFARGLEEVSLWMTSTQVRVRSWSESQSFGAGHTQIDAAVAETTRSLQTELTINSTEFDTYHLANSHHPIELTFGLREFKAILQYADAMALPISAHFDRGGDPLLVNVGSMRQTDQSLRYAHSSIAPPDDLMAEFVLATISDNMNSSTGKNSYTPTSHKISAGCISAPHTDSIQAGSHTPQRQILLKNAPMNIDISESTSPQQSFICERVDEISIQSEDHQRRTPQELRRSDNDLTSIYDIIDPKIVPSPSPYQSSKASNNRGDLGWNLIDVDAVDRADSFSEKTTPTSSKLGRRAAAASSTDMKGPMSPMIQVRQASTNVSASQVAVNQTPPHYSTDIGGQRVVADRGTSMRSYRLLDMPRPQAPPGVTDSRDICWGDGSDDDDDISIVAPPGKIQTRLPFQQAAATAAVESAIPLNMFQEEAGNNANDSNTDMSSDEEVEATPPPSSKRIRSLF